MKTLKLKTFLLTGVCALALSSYAMSVQPVWAQGLNVDNPRDDVNEDDPNNEEDPNNDGEEEEEPNDDGLTEDENEGEDLEDGYEEEPHDVGGDDNPGDTLVPGASPYNPYEIRRRLNATPETTTTVTSAVETSYSYCNQLRRPEYRVDCMAVELEVIAKSMPSAGDYAEAREILLEASQKMRKLVSDNRAPAKPRIRVKGRIKGNAVTSKPIRAVRADKIKSVDLQAAKILEEAETKLLRSAQASDRRLIAYAKMAKAVGSNKTLLRSA